MSDSLRLPWTAAHQASLSLAISQSLPKFMSIASMMPSSHLILWRPVLLLPSIFPSIRVFSNESAVHIRWPKYWSFSFSISPSNEYSGLISFRTDWLELLAVQGTLKSLLQHHSLKASIEGYINWRKILFSLLHFIKFQISLQKTRCKHLQHSFGAPGGSDSKRVCLQCGRPGFNPCVRKILWKRKWQPTPIFLPGESHVRGITELDRTERLHFHFLSLFEVRIQITYF